MDVWERLIALGGTAERLVRDLQQRLGERDYSPLLLHFNLSYLTKDICKGIIPEPTSYAQLVDALCREYRANQEAFREGVSHGGSRRRLPPP